MLDSQDPTGSSSSKKAQLQQQHEAWEGGWLVTHARVRTKLGGWATKLVRMAS